MDDDLEKANTILREVMTYRKKTKDCYARHQPTPSPFWDSLFQKTYPLTNETSPSCVMLQEQIRSYIAQGCEKFSNELLSGTIPETLYNGIQFYLNYILHVIHVQIPDEDIKQAALSHANQIDALNEYSIGALLGVMKFVFYGLYNPLSGELVAEKDHRPLFPPFFHLVETYMKSDLWNFTRILYQRVCAEFPALQNPVFTQLMQATLTNAVFVHTAPMLQSVVQTRCAAKNAQFIAALEKYRAEKPEGISLLACLREECAAVQSFTHTIDLSLELVSPLSKLANYQALMTVGERGSVEHRTCSSTWCRRCRRRGGRWRRRRSWRTSTSL